jgi:hypothetical protein
MTTPNNLPFFSNGLTTPSDWVNQYMSLFSFLTAYPQVELIFTTPTPIVPGKVYLIGSPQTGVSPGTSGDAIVYLTTSNLSAVPLNSLPVNTVIGGYTKSGANWNRGIFTNGGIFVASASGSLTLPTTFDGVCTLVVNNTGVTVVQAAGRTGSGKINTVLPIGVYQVFQNGLIAVI